MCSSDLAMDKARPNRTNAHERMNKRPVNVPEKGSVMGVVIGGILSRHAFSSGGIGYSLRPVDTVTPMPQSKKKIIQHLKNELYCKLGVSPVHGIGVFAIRSIPKGVNPLKTYVTGKEVDVPKRDIKRLPLGIKNQIKMFCFYDRKKVCVPEIGMNSFHLSVYLNHSKQPNLRFKHDGSLVTLTRIEEGEELFIDYDRSFGEKHQFD